MGDLYSLYCVLVCFMLSSLCFELAVVRRKPDTKFSPAPTCDTKSNKSGIFCMENCNASCELCRIGKLTDVMMALLITIITQLPRKRHSGRGNGARVEAQGLTAGCFFDPSGALIRPKYHIWYFLAICNILFRVEHIFVALVSV